MLALKPNTGNPDPNYLNCDALYFLQAKFLKLLMIFSILIHNFILLKCGQIYKIIFTSINIDGFCFIYEDEPVIIEQRVWPFIKLLN